MQDLSEAAKSAMIAVGTNRQGATIPPVAMDVERELRTARLIGPSMGLTMRGTIARERIVDALMEMLF